MRVTLKLLGPVLLLLFSFLIVIVCSKLLFRTTWGGPDYADMLVRITGQTLECSDFSDAASGKIILSYDKSDYSLHAATGTTSVKLTYAGSSDFTDYFEGPAGQEIEVDPEIKASGFAENVGGVCS